jgi:putative membrane protein
MNSSHWHRLRQSLFQALIAINIVSIFGYSFFGLHPENLVSYPWATQIFSASYPFFAQLQIWVALLCYLAFLQATVARKWWVSFAAVFFLSFISEYCGVTWGVPFGKYEYTSLLGWKIADTVPLLIPPSWYFMALPAWVIADRIAGQQDRWWPVRVPLASLLLLIWDLSLDPAMSHLVPFWVWEDAGTYFGMPFMNLVGWFITGLVIMAAFEVLKVQRWARPTSFRFHLGFYAVNLMLPLGMVIVAGHALPVVITLATGALCASLVRAIPRPQPT